MDTALLIGIINAVVLVVGYLLTRRGAKEAHKQQTAANVLAEREADWKRRGDVIADLEKTVEAKNARIAHLLEVCSKAQAASIDTIAMLKQVVRSETAEEIASLGIQEATRHVREDH